MAANMNEHETFSGVISFEEINFCKSTTENLTFFEDEEEEANIMIHKEYTIITGFKLQCVFSIMQLRDNGS